MIEPVSPAEVGQWFTLLPVAELPEGFPIPYEVDTEYLLLVRFGAVVKCYKNQCSHLERPLDMGRMDGDVITCPFHGYRFSLLRGGKCVSHHCAPLVSYAVRISAAERVEVCLPL